MEEKNREIECIYFLLMEISAEYVCIAGVSYSVLLLLAGCGMCLLLSFTAG